MKKLIIFFSVLSFVSCSQQRPTNVLSEPPSFSEFKASKSEMVAYVADTEPGNNCNEECADFRQEMRFLLYVAKQIYPYWEEKKNETGMDYEAFSKSLETSITNETTLTEYYRLVRQWAAAFHDGHVSANSADKLSKLEIYSSQVRLQIIAPGTENEKVYVAASKNLPITVGDEVLEADGLPIKQALDKAEFECSGSTKGMRRRCAIYRITDVLGLKNAKPLTLKYRRGEAENSISIARKVSLLPVGVKDPAEDETGSTLISATILPNEIGYLKIDGFMGTQMRSLINQAMDRMMDTKALIIDMRENGGGDQSGNEILARLTENNIVRYRTSFRNSDLLIAKRPDLFFMGFDPSKPFTDWADVSVKAADSSRRYLGKPVVVLTSSWCFSACDTFVSAIKTNKLAIVMGENTGGGTGSPISFSLPASEFSFRYSVVRGITANNQPIEGVGTQPDILVSASVTDITQGTDSQLVAAMDFVTKKIGSGATSGSLLPTQNSPVNLDISVIAEDEIKMRRYMLNDERNIN